MQRFFVPTEAIVGREVHFTGEQSKQLSAVLRARPGESVVVLDNSGWSYDVTLRDVDSTASVGSILRRSLATGEPRTKITLYQALLKADKLEMVLQKGTEVGVTTFAPIISSRCVVANLPSETRQQRWERIIAEAAEQSERGRLPLLQPAMMFDQACEQMRGKSFLAWEGETSRHLESALEEISRGATGNRPFSLNLVIGPEGGFAEDEVERARSYGITTVSLGSRPLRAETAALVIAALVLYHFKDLG